MKKISLTLPDGSQLEFPTGVIGADVIKKISPKEEEDATRGDAIALKVDETQIVDLMTPLEKNCRIRILTPKDPESLEVLRHSSAHIMSEAVQALFKGVKVTIGPATQEGFYYDYDYDSGFTPKDLVKIEKKMAEIIEAKKPFCRSVVSKPEAIEVFRKMNEDYKIEIIEGIKEGEVSIYTQGGWKDLCRGPHLPHAGWVKAFKLLSLAGAYWRGDEKNKMLQRIYGTAFFSKKDLDDYLIRQEEAKKRDHRKLAKELDLFSFQSESPANPFFHPKGKILYDLLVAYWEEEHRQGQYQLVKTPFILSSELWHRSGHYENYKENMYFVKIDPSRGDDKDYAVKPMNCPGHILIFNTKKLSYRDLPLRLAEIGQVHRYELAGVTHGLMRTRTFCIDDAHIFCTEDQIEAEIVLVIKLILSMYQTFGFKEYKIELSTRPQKSIGSDEVWEKAISALRDALKKLNLDFQLNEGEGAFYGPKIDFHVKDVLQRTWQCGTIQLDFSMPQRFNLTYIGSDGKEYQPVMIHRAVYGSVERFLGILIEHFGGAFPLWLSPVQVGVMNVTDKQKAYAQRVTQLLREAGIRVECDVRNEKLGFKIRQAQIQKIPYMLVIGDREMKSQTVTPRLRTGENVEPLSIEAFLQNLKTKIAQRRE